MPPFNGAQPGSGRKPGSRNRLSHAFKTALLEDFEKHGADAIKIVRVEDPARYLAVIASVCPRELQVETGLSELDDSELDMVIEQLKARALEARQQQAIDLRAEPLKVIASNGNGQN